MTNQPRASDTNALEEVPIYLRNSQKRAHLIRIQKEINQKDLLRVVSERLKIAADKLILFHKGEELVP